MQGSIGEKNEIRFEIFLRCFLKTQVETVRKPRGGCLELMLGFLFGEMQMLYGDGCTGREADIPQPYNLKRWSVWFVD